jgi:glycosyltransferase involved in cell wall biosynthesis
MASVRILYILTSLGIGGAEKQVIDLAERMAAKGHPVAFLVLKHTGEEWPVKLPVLRLNIAKTPLGILRGLRFARKFTALFHPDLVHSHTFPANIFARLLKLMMRTDGPTPRLINTIHNVHEGGWHRMLIYRLTSSLVNKVTAVSIAAAERFVRLRAVPVSKMSVLTNGIDADAFSPDRGRRKRTRIQMHTGNAFVWIAVGRLVTAKDYPNLLHAFQEVRKANPSSRLWIVGEGDTSEQGARHFAGAEEYGVELLGLRHDIADLLDAADGYVLSSAWEGMPLALTEAMAMEKPAVATDVGGVRELMGDAGLIVAPNDSAALAASMVKVMGMNEFERRSIGKKARERVMSLFSIAAKAMEWEQLYKEFIYDKNS